MHWLTIWFDDGSKLKSSNYHNDNNKRIIIVSIMTKKLPSYRHGYDIFMIGNDLVAFK